jgi:hypothetical protein
MVVWGFNAVNVIALVGVSMLLAHASAKGQVVGIAATRFAMGALLFAPTLLYILMQHSRISLGDLWKTARPSILAALAVAAVLLPFSRLTPGCKSVVLLVVEVTLGGLTGMAVLLTLDDKLRNAALAPILAAMRTRGRVGTDGRLRELRDPVGD